ncbi:hypothetical protein ACFLZV_02320 [Candidatus Margulisiibacteriota bacterium]
MKKLLLFSLTIFFLSISPLLAEENMVTCNFNIKFGAVTTTGNYNYIKVYADTYLTKTQFVTKINTTTCNALGYTTDWSFIDNSINTQIRASRHSNNIYLQGKINNQTIDIGLSIDGSPWFQSPEYAVTQMLKNSLTYQEFWIFDYEVLNISKVSLQIVGQESLTINNVDTMCTKVAIKASDSEWQSVFWCRQSDYLVVQYTGNFGPTDDAYTLTVTNLEVSPNF